MDLSKILSISGKNGLYKVVSQSKNSIIVESLIDGKKIPVFATDRSSSLEDISVFTYGEDLPLKDILIRIYKQEDGKSAIDPKSGPDALKAYFETIVPEYDKERVYTSDMKKMLGWYNLLLEKELISLISADEENADSSPDELKAEKADKIKGAQAAIKKTKAVPDKMHGQAGGAAAKRKTRQKV